GVPGQVHAVHGRASGRQGVDEDRQHPRHGDPDAARLHRAHHGHGAQAAPPGQRAPHRIPAELVTTATPGGSHMATAATAKNSGLVEMNWDPITRIVGSLGIYTRIDFNAKKVAECHATSSIFRGYSIFMKGKDPRDSHFITSRICGICGDNHCACSCYTQQMAYGVKPPHIAEWMVNLGEAAE